MHRRVAQTVAAVLPRTYGWHSNPGDARRITDESLYEPEHHPEPAHFGQQDSGYNSDPYDNTDPERAHWRRMDSHGESILSGLSDDEHDNRMRRSPESLRPRHNLLGRVAEEDNAGTSTGLRSSVASDPPYDAPDEDEELEWELEQYGLYRGSYRRLLALYSFVPITAVVTLDVIALLPLLIWPSPESPSRYPPYLPSPIPELALSSAMFSLEYLLRAPLYSMSVHILPSGIASLLSTFLSVLVMTLLRLMSLVILDVRHNMEYPIPTWQDPSFLTIWWLSLNVAEILAALVQDYQNISLYRDLMVPYGREQEFLARWKRASPTSPLLETNGHVYDLREPPRSSSQDHISSFRDAEDHPTHELGENNDTLGARIEHDLDELLAVEARKELEEIYGVPVIKIPVFITCLQRFNSIILSFGLNLLLSAAFLRSPLSIPASDITSVPSDVFSYSPLCVTFPVVLCIHTSLASLYNPVILPRIGVHTAAYVGVLVSLMCFFAGLAVWGALS